MTSLLLTFLATLTCATAATVTLRWDANPEPDLVAYELRYGPDPKALTGKSRVLALTTQTTVQLEPGIYHFEVVAIGRNGLVSAPSNRVVYEVLPPQVPPTAPKGLTVIETRTTISR